MSVQTMPAVGCLDSMFAAGFDDFEINVPYHDLRPYKIFLFNNGDHWMASMEDNLANGREVAAGEGATPGEALWDMTDGQLHSAKGWTGDVSALPHRIMLVAAILWAEATGKTAEEDTAKATAALAEAAAQTAAYTRACADRDALFDRTTIDAW